MNSRISDDHHEANLRKVVHTVEVHRGDVDGLAGLHGGPLRAQRQLRRVLAALHLYNNQSRDYIKLCCGPNSIGSLDPYRNPDPDPRGQK